MLLTKEDSYALMVQLMDKGILRRAELLNAGVRQCILNVYFTIERRKRKDKILTKTGTATKKLELKTKKHDVFYERKVEIRSSKGLQLLFEETAKHKTKKISQTQKHKTKKISQRQKLKDEIARCTIDRAEARAQREDCRRSVIAWMSRNNHKYL